jgi:hypothetical protein
MEQMDARDDNDGVTDTLLRLIVITMHGLTLMVMGNPFPFIATFYSVQSYT